MTNVIRLKILTFGLPVADDQCPDVGRTER